MYEYGGYEETKPWLLTVAQVRERLPLSKARIYQLLASGELPAVQVGRRLMVSASELDAFIASHRRRVPGEYGPGEYEADLSVDEHGNPLF